MTRTGTETLPYYDNRLVQLYQADAREIPLEDGTVHCCVTSPPYFGLRVYQTDDARVLGLESSIEEYIGNLVDVFREVKRVLRDDGVCWINMGDSYSGSGKGQNGDGTHASKHGEKQHTSKGTLTGGLPINSNHALEGNRVDELAGGNLLGVPWCLALALQADGWILRDSIVWAKANPMPESLAGWRWERCRVKIKAQGKGSQPSVLNGGPRSRDMSNGVYFDSAEYAPCPGCAKCCSNDGLVLRKGSWRCTGSHEFIFMLVKNMGYWADGEAVKHLAVEGKKWDTKPYTADSGHTNGTGPFTLGNTPITGVANRRNVWRDIHAEPYHGEHYATFPPDLPRLCIQASTSEQGCCPKCGAQVTRVVEKDERLATSRRGNDDYGSGGTTKEKLFTSATPGVITEVTTLGWRPTCGHTEAVQSPEPCLALDPFMGAGATTLAAMRLNRRCVGIDLSEEYLNQARVRLSEQTLPMPLVSL